MEIVSEHRSFGGMQGVYRHASAVCDCDMTFAVYLPPHARGQTVPLLWYLSGLTCTHENAMTKAGLQEHAARHGIALAFPDTSPRGSDIADDSAYDLGQGAGFYINATQEPWKAHFHMYDYVIRELRDLIEGNFPINDRHGITGHSMGGHGALTLAMGNPDMFQSLSAFSPIANPSGSDWGRKQFSAYLGDDESGWSQHDAAILMSERGWNGDILIDQGASDQFLELLRPETLVKAIARRRQPAVFRMQQGYDHSYFFVASFGADHVNWHAERLT